jgi:hypothetical protein
VRTWRTVVSAAVCVAALAGAGCTSTSETTELSDDQADVTVPGVPPTAPPTTEYDGSGLTSDARQLIADLAALEEETDLCAILSGEAIEPFLSGQVDTTTLITSPSGLNQLLAVLNTIFAHIVEISPPEVQSSTAVLEDVWTQVGSISSAAPDYEAQVQVITDRPEVSAAYDTVGTWAVTNCGASLLPAA